jgi:2-methylaconitate cis-trans-isomerase PrpF
MEIPCVIMRGGSSKGLFFHADDLPKDPALLTQLLLRVMGSPDPRQIDGLGGADALTSRVAIISHSQRSDADIEYQFALVHIKEAIVEFKGTCGNMMSGVGPFAIDEGLIEPQEPKTNVRIYDVNTKQHILAEIPVEGGKAKTKGSYALSGVPGTGARIDLHFYNPGGTITGKLLPTGKEREFLETPKGVFEVSLIDAIAPTVFVRAKDLHLRGNEMPHEIDGNAQALELLETIRKAAGLKMGIAASDFLPKVAFISPSHGVGSFNARMMSLGKMHKTFAVSCGICTAIAAFLPGTIVHELFGSKGELVHIAHPAGTVDVGVILKGTEVVEVVIPRTARRLMKGVAYTD